jgi:putative ATP-binding cassette transporter
MESTESPQGQTSGRHQATDEVPPEARTGQGDRLAVERYRFRLFWRTASGFWRGESRRLAWFLTLSLLVLVLLDIAVQYGINVWNRQIFDALEQ